MITIECTNSKNSIRINARSIGLCLHNRIVYNQTCFCYSVNYRESENEEPNMSMTMLFKLNMYARPSVSFRHFFASVSISIF